MLVGWLAGWLADLRRLVRRLQVALYSRLRRLSLTTSRARLFAARTVRRQRAYNF